MAGGNFFFDVMPRQVQAKADKKKKEGIPNGNGSVAYLPLPLVLASLNPLHVSEAIEGREGEEQLCAGCRSRSLNSLGVALAGSSEGILRKSGSADSFPNPSSEGRLGDSPGEDGEGGMPIRGDGSNGGLDGGEEYTWAGLQSLGSELTRRKQIEGGMRMDGLDRTVCAS